jgi:predicted Zn-dependent protease
VLIVYGAAGALRVADAIRARQLAKASACVGLILALAVVQQTVIPIRSVRNRDMYAVHRPEYTLSAEIYASEGKPGRAVAEIERLQMKAKENASFSDLLASTYPYEGNFRAAWAQQLLQEGKREDARRQTDLAGGAYAHQPRVSYPYSNLGLLYLALNEPATAKVYFQRFLDLEPDGPRADAVRAVLSKL